MTPFQHPIALAARPPGRPAPAAAAPDRAAGEALVSVRGLVKSYGPASVLEGVDLELRRGRVTALIGPNASGKTTLIKCLLGLVRPDAGSIRVDGREVGPAETEYRGRIGYMPQAPRFPDSLTGRELLALLRALRPGAEIDEELVHALGLEADLGRPLRTRSGGTRQKVNAAAAFLFRPDVIILDEPTAGLDPVAAGALKDKLRRERARGAAILLTSHVTSELDELADDVVFLLNGSIRYAGTLQGLRSETGEQRLERAVAHLMTGRS